MAKKTGNGMQTLGILGGVGLMILAWRFPVPLIIAPSTTLLSVIAISLGILIGPARAVAITAIYVLALVLDLPPALWGKPVEIEPFLSLPVNGLNLGLVAAALVAGLLTPKGANAHLPRLALAVVAAHLAYLLVGIVWLIQFGPPLKAAEVMLQSQGIAVVIKSAVALAIVALAGTRFKR